MTPVDRQKFRPEETIPSMWNTQWVFVPQVSVPLYLLLEPISRQLRVVINEDLER